MSKIESAPRVTSNINKSDLIELISLLIKDTMEKPSTNPDIYIKAQQLNGLVDMINNSKYPLTISNCPTNPGRSMIIGEAQIKANLK